MPTELPAFAVACGEEGSDPLVVHEGRVGEGPRLLIIADLISNAEATWEHELYRRTLEHVGKHLTCAYFDKRGIGMSDRFDEAPTIEQRNEDVLAVMDALGWESAHLFGQSEGGAMAQLFAADHPERVESVTITNSFPPPRYLPRIFDFVREDDPPILTKEEIYEHFEVVLETWGEDASYLIDWSMPSQTGNESFARWMTRLMRMAASPKDFKRQLDSIMDLDGGRRARTHHGTHDGDAHEGRQGAPREPGPTPRRRHPRRAVRGDP